MRDLPTWARPSLLSVTLAGVGEAVAVAVRYREVFVDRGMGVWSSHYWPWYVHSHGDNVTPASPLLFVLNFLTGVLVFLPVAQAAALAVRRSGRWPPDALAGRPALRPGLGKTLLAFVAAVVLAPLGIGGLYVTVFALPGTLVMLVGVWTARALGLTVEAGPASAVPYAVSLSLWWLAASALWERRLGAVAARVDWTRWLVGRDTGRARRHLLVGAGLAVGFTLALAVVGALDAYPRYANWYDPGAALLVLGTAAVHAYHNDGLATSLLLAAALFAVLLSPIRYELVTEDRYVTYAEQFVIHIPILGTLGFCAGAAGRRAVGLVRAYWPTEDAPAGEA